MRGKNPTGRVLIGDDGDKWECGVEILITKEIAGEIVQLPLMGIPTYYIEKESGRVTSKPLR